MKTRITEKLLVALQPTLLKVIDESAQHQGHAGWRAGGETHFRLILDEGCLAGLGRVERHRRIYAILEAELQDGIHALAIQFQRA
jgi:BolA family transcriptional regulator, general stress-responsive regulator